MTGRTRRLIAGYEIVCGVWVIISLLVGLIAGPRQGSVLVVAVTLGVAAAFSLFADRGSGGMPQKAVGCPCLSRPCSASESAFPVSPMHCVSALERTSYGSGIRVLLGPKSSSC